MDTIDDGDEESGAAPVRELEPLPRVVRYGTITVELADEDQPLPKSKLTKRELAQFMKMLLEKRRELVGDVTHLASEAFAQSGNSSMPLHMADVGTDNWEQEFNIELLQTERVLVREIDAALQRIGERTYGVCLATHKPIDKARLTAKPWAKYCIDYARLRELGRVP
ncbi:MAG: TraR/DksA family transcriptional regulator [Phycisphaerales bacterium]|nr:TraR/DksA family transcriptional regulator [Phycisphaerales bacterium]